MFFIRSLNPDGEPVATIHFDTHEQIGYFCLECGEPHILENEKFWKAVTKHGIYGVCFRCANCAAKYQAGKKRTPTGGNQ